MIDGQIDSQNNRWIDSYINKQIETDIQLERYIDIDKSNDQI